MTILLIRWTVLMMLVSPSGRTWANDGRNNAPNQSSFQTQHWTTNDGLPQNQISCLQQTRDGYLWIGTWFGLARFDGVRFVRFNQFNTPALAGDDTITSLAEDAAGTLWIATRTGLVTFRNHQFKRMKLNPPLQNTPLISLVPDSKQGVWLYAPPYVVRGTESTFHIFGKPLASPIDAPIGIQSRPDSGVTVLTRDACFTWQDEAGRQTNYLRTTGIPVLLAGVFDAARNRHWLGTEAGLYEIDGGQARLVENEMLRSNQVHGVWLDHSGNVWANARSAGLLRWDGTQWETIHLPDGMEPGQTTCLEQDFEGNLWLGTTEGLVQISFPPARTYTTRDGLPHNHVWSVCEGGDGAIWVATDRGIAALQHGRAVKQKTPGAIETWRPRCVWPHPTGIVWAAGQNMTKQVKLSVTEDSEPVDWWYFPGLITGFGGGPEQLYVFTSEGIVERTDCEPLASLTPNINLPLRDVCAMAQESGGAQWFSRKKNGLVRRHRGTLEYFSQTNGLPPGTIYALHIDRKNTLWAGGESGLVRYHNGQFFTYTTAQGLRENTINCILEDDDGHLWISGLEGIYRLSLRELNAVAHGLASGFTCFTLGAADGMEGNETNGEAQPAGWKARDGRLWFPTVRGVVVVDPKRIPQNEKPPLAWVEQVRVDAQLLFGNGGETNQTSPSLSGEWHIPAGLGHLLEFTYTGNSFLDAKQVRFRYRLAGADKEWRAETRERSVRYANLPPGTYRFEVLAANAHNLWSRQPASFAFVIAPHFWQRPVFFVVVAAALGVLFAGLQAYRLRWQHRLLKSEEQRALANERTRIARELHDDLGTALTGLALELDVAGKEAQRPGTAPAHNLAHTAQRTRALAQRMREVVWAVNPNCDTVSSLANFLEQQVEQFLRTDDVRVRLHFPEDIPALPLNGEIRHHLALSVREALTNAMRHARATEVAVTLAITPEKLCVSVQDNGCGFSGVPRQGHGMQNMRVRMEQIRGSFACTAAPGQGVLIQFCMPLPATISGKEKG